ncbi:Hsp20/alpha crystallin family protein [bacterium]|nr:Hsp20/alpha crystallin family protein [bacterium]
MLPALYNGSPLTRPTNRLSHLFEQFFRDDPFPPPAMPPLAVWEDTNAVYVEMDVPGVASDDIDLSVHDGTLTIQAERKAEARESGYEGRSFGKVVQRVALPAPVTADGVEAVTSNGVLRVTLPKTPDSKPRKIAVRPS